MKIIITTLFGLETPVREDLEAIGFTKDLITVQDGVVTLEAGEDWPLQVARVNMWVRRGERVLLDIGEFKAEDFDSFFDGTKALPWNDFIPKDYAYVVNGFSRKSKLFGVPALQSLAKKAIAKSILTSRNASGDGILYEDPGVGTVKIQFGIVNDVCRFMVDTTGEGLHKRGYRPLTHEAPIRETLASGMVSLARYSPFGCEALYDPFCGSGTIVIEAALMALNIAPGKLRRYAYEDLPYIGNSMRRQALKEALDLEDLTPMEDCFFYGSDIDPKAVQSARRNAEAAGVGDFVKFMVSDCARITTDNLVKLTGFDRQLILTNPPYGGRLMTPEEADEIYRLIARQYLTRSGKCKIGVRLSAITPDAAFEEATGFKADKRVKLYNGNILCHLFNYYKLDKTSGNR
ncbi:MAG: class I SAM-dependent RNA methyltransferase [Saccharofermentans sp.]|nr:class I SAM-dependent RNA methyltransferase [Saccharofermentans sp.]